MIFLFSSDYVGLGVNNLGFGGLVPDEEADLEYNPAYINLIDGKRIFTGIDSNCLRTNSKDCQSDPDSYTSLVSRSGKNILREHNPYLEYLHSFENFKLAIKYYPSFSRYNYNYEEHNYFNYYSGKYENIDSEEINYDEVGNVRTIFGWRVKQDLIIGINIGLNTHKYEYLDEY